MRMILLLFAFGVLPCALLRATVVHGYEKRAVELRTSEITSQAKLVAAQIMAADYLANPSQDTVTTQLDQISTLYDGRVVLINSDFCIVKDTYSLDDGKTILSAEVFHSYQGQSVSKYDKNSRYIELTLPLTDTTAKQKNVEGVMLVSVSTDSISKTVAYLKNWFLVWQIILGIVIVTLLPTVISVVRSAMIKKRNNQMKR